MGRESTIFARATASNSTSAKARRVLEPRTSGVHLPKQRAGSSGHGHRSGGVTPLDERCHAPIEIAGRLDRSCVLRTPSIAASCVALSGLRSSRSSTAHQAPPLLLPLANHVSPGTNRPDQNRLLDLAPANLCMRARR